MLGLDFPRTIDCGQFWVWSFDGFDEEECRAAFEHALEHLPSVDDLVAHNQADRDSYAISVRRFKDFLSFEIERGEEDAAFTICFKEGSSFRLEKGTVAGVRRAKLRLHRSHVSRESGQWKIDYIWDFDGKPYPRASVIEKPVRREMRIGVEPDSGVSTDSYPAAATDDRVLLPDHSFLMIPQGLGGFVYRLIQEAL